MSPEQFVKLVVTNVEEGLTSNGKILPLKCVTTRSSNDAHWMEYPPELTRDGVQRYQELICKLSWAVYIRRLGILLEMSLLSSYLAMPRVGYPEQALYIFG